MDAVVRLVYGLRLVTLPQYRVKFRSRMFNLLREHFCGALGYVGDWLFLMRHSCVNTSPIFAYNVLASGYQRCQTVRCYCSLWLLETAVASDTDRTTVVKCLFPFCFLG